MKRKGPIKVLAMIFALLLFVAVPLMAACTPAEGNVARLLRLGDYTGPIAVLSIPADQGVEDYFRYVNDRGGVDGVRLILVSIDTRYDVARGVSAFVAHQDDPMLLMVDPVSTPMTEALAPLIAARGLINYGTCDGKFQAELGRTFLWGVPYQDGFAAFIDWAVEDWQAKGNPGTPTIGYMNWDSAYGYEYMKGGQEYAALRGVTLLDPEYYPTTELDHSPYLMRLRDGGANYIFVGGVEPAGTNVIRKAHEMGLTDDIVFSADWWGISKAGASAHADELEGALIVSFFLRGAEAEQTFAGDLWVESGRGTLEDMNEIYAMGVALSKNFEEGVRLALQEVGYEGLDGEALYDAFQQLTGMERFGLVGPVAYDEDDRRGSTVVKFYQVQNGEIVPITDWREAPDSVSLYYGD